MIDVQIITAVVRPGKSSRIRRAWNVWHWYNGRLLVAIAIGKPFLSVQLILRHVGQVARKDIAS